jgi:hypothetical protein
MTSTSPKTGNGRTVASMHAAFGRGDVAYVLAQMASGAERTETEAGNMCPFTGCGELVSVDCGEWR